MPSRQAPHHKSHHPPHTARCGVCRRDGLAIVHTHNERQPTHSTHHLSRKNLWPPCAWEQNPARGLTVGRCLQCQVSCVPKMSRHPAKRENLGPGCWASRLLPHNQHQPPSNRAARCCCPGLNQEVDPGTPAADRATPEQSGWGGQHTHTHTSLALLVLKTPGTQPQQQQPFQNRGDSHLNRPVAGFMNGSHAAHMQAVSPLYTQTHTQTHTDMHATRLCRCTDDWSNGVKPSRKPPDTHNQHSMLLLSPPLAFLSGSQAGRAHATRSSASCQACEMHPAKDR